MRAIELPLDYATVLRHVSNEEEDFNNLAETMSFDRRRLQHIIIALQHKGLVRVTWKRRDGWVSLSSHGRRLVSQMWPAPRLRYGF